MDFLEPFCLLGAQRRADGVGGTETQYTAVRHFLAAVTDQPGTARESGGLPIVQTRPVLLHESGVSLHLHQMIRRVRDGAEFRVMGESDDQRTPDCAMLSYACVPVEKAVSAL